MADVLSEFTPTLFPTLLRLPSQRCDGRGLAVRRAPRGRAGRCWRLLTPSEAKAGKGDLVHRMQSDAMSRKATMRVVAQILAVLDPAVRLAPT
jgi:hypothetical protein